MRGCSVVNSLRIVRGGIEDYKRLAKYHYRSGSAGTYTSIFTIRPSRAVGTQLGDEPIGVIVYGLPSAGSELRNIATGTIFSGFDNQTRLGLINKNIRCIRRVVIEPRFRGLGLASRLVRETMPEAGVAIVEAMAVMGLVNPFFEKAGMKAYRAGRLARCVRLADALSLVGIEEDELIDAEKVQGKLNRLEKREAVFIEEEIERFLQSYGKRQRRPGLKRARFILSKLTERPVYYVWFNEKMEIKV